MKMDLLADFEMLQKDAAGKPLTATTAINAINDTAKAMETLYDSVKTAQTHLKLKDK